MRNVASFVTEEVLVQDEKLYHSLEEIFKDADPLYDERGNSYEHVHTHTTEIEGKFVDRLTKDELFNVMAGVNEPIVNAIEHSGENPEYRVRVYESDDNYLVVCAEWGGSGYNLKDIPDCTTEERLLAPGGRGHTMLEELADKVVFNGDATASIALFKYSNQ